MKETYIDKNNRVRLTYAGSSQKYGPCELTGKEGAIYHYRVHKRTKSGGWKLVFSSFCTFDAALCRLSNYKEKVN